MITVRKKKKLKKNRLLPKDNSKANIDFTSVTPIFSYVSNKL